jgi:hypothetical protein
MNFREQNYHIVYTVKYLHFVLRFIIKNAIFSLFVSKSLIKSLKSIFNSTLIRTYVQIVRDNKKNKKWRSKVRMTAEKSCYQLVLDKKTIENILNFDFNSKLNNSSYHFIDSYESRIAKRHIWFIQSIIMSNDRKQTAALCVRNYYKWKKKTQLTFMQHSAKNVLKICWAIELLCTVVSWCCWGS